MTFLQVRRPEPFEWARARLHPSFCCRRRRIREERKLTEIPCQNKKGQNKNQIKSCKPHLTFYFFNTKSSMFGFWCVLSLSPLVSKHSSAAMTLSGVGSSVAKRFVSATLTFPYPGVSISFHHELLCVRHACLPHTLELQRKKMNTMSLHACDH